MPTLRDARGFNKHPSAQPNSWFCKSCEHAVHVFASTARAVECRCVDLSSNAFRIGHSLLLDLILSFAARLCFSGWSCCSSPQGNPGLCPVPAKQYECAGIATGVMLQWRHVHIFRCMHESRHTVYKRDPIMFLQAEKLFDGGYISFAANDSGDMISSIPIFLKSSFSRC